MQTRRNITAILGSIVALIGGNPAAIAHAGSGFSAAQASFFAQATPPSDGSDLNAPDRPSSSTYTGYATSGPPRLAVATSSLSVSGVTCTTYADNPHVSTHVPGTINAVVRQVCNIAVQNNSTEAKLWERRWWGYDIIDGPRYSALTYSTTSQVETNAACRTNSIRVTGYGHFLYGGQHYVSQEVSNTKDVSC